MFECNFEEKEVKSKGKNLVVAEAMVVIRGNIPRTSLIQAEECSFSQSTETMSSDACTRLNNTPATCSFRYFRIIPLARLQDHYHIFRISLGN